MRRRLIVPAAAAVLPLIAFAAALPQDGTRSLLEGAALKPSSAETTVARSGAGATVSTAVGGDAYPGVALVPAGGAWDLSRFGHVEARLTNTGANAITVSLRVDNAGDWRDNPWNTESVTLQPGETGTVRTIFGYQYGQKKGYRLNPAKVVQALLFTTKAEAAQSYRIESLVAGGPAGEAPVVAPDDVRVKPASGRLLDARLLGEGGVRTDVQGNATASGMRLRFPAGGVDALVRYRPKIGRWDLRDSSRVRVRLRNVGSAPAAASLALESNGGPSKAVEVPSLAPGATTVVDVPFGRPVDLNVPATLTGLTSDSVSALTVRAGAPSTPTELELLSVEAVAATARVPDWQGKRPPVPGTWTKTLGEEFSGTKLDPRVWKVTGENYYDKATHWTKENVIVKDGFARVRYSKKAGHQNDDPKRDSTPYAAGYLDTFGLWAQRYGYFEARVRVPRAPGLWPAFWMMPDRGSRGGPEQWKRQFTGDGAMEFDILESLTRWGPHRTNVAMHYDGYEKDHKALGSDKVYFETDKDGFVTCGLLWLPGEAVYYYNGREALRWKSPRVSNVPSILMFTLPSGGWDNDAVDDARLPDDLAIDYVRVWQRKDLASPVDGRRNDPQR